MTNRRHCRPPPVNLRATLKSSQLKRDTAATPRLSGDLTADPCHQRLELTQQLKQRRGRRARPTSGQQQTPKTTREVQEAHPQVPQGRLWNSSKGRRCWRCCRRPRRRSPDIGQSPVSKLRWCSHFTTECSWRSTSLFGPMQQHTTAQCVQEPQQRPASRRQVSSGGGGGVIGIWRLPDPGRHRQ